MTSDNSARDHKVVAWTFVAAQAALIIGAVITPQGYDWAVLGVIYALGLLFKGVGVVLGVWAAFHLGRGLTPSPLPNGATDLVTRGPYRWIRHPMYTAVMAYVFGIALHSGTWLVVLAALALASLFYFKSQWEERRLAEVFDGYVRYQETTPRFIPRLKSGRGEPDRETARS